jgi:hypothetical protein
LQVNFTFENGSTRTIFSEVLRDLNHGLDDLNYSLHDLNYGLDIKDQFLPLECQYMNTNAISSIGAGKQPTTPKKHFELRRIPKSASLRSELLAKSEDLSTAKVKSTKSDFPVLKRFSGNDQEIKFREIEIHVFYEIKAFAKLIRRLKLAFCKIVQEIKRALGP